MSAQESGSFTLESYLREHLPMAGVWALFLAAIFGAALVLGVTPWGAALLCLLAALACCICLAWDFFRKRAYYRDLEQAIAQLEKVRYLSAFVSQPGFLEGRLSWEACETLAHLSGQELGQAETEAEAYRSYIETWVHEIKTPIAASRLILGRMRGADATALREELESIERFVEQVLFYSRSRNLSADYAVRELCLADVAKEACKRNQNLLIARGITPIIDVDPVHKAFSDESWLIFILGQLLSNAAKYGATTIRISSQAKGEGPRGSMLLEVADNGAGIPQEDMPRIFEQGFVGANGRAEGSATGMGLYLCAQLCQAMGMGIDAYSQVGSGTRIVLTLPVNRDFLNLTQA